MVHQGYRRDIDGLRAVAVLSVVAFHVAPRTITGGFVGVDIFFVISGFLISRILFSEVESTGSLSFARFYQRRIQRIFPALVLVLAAGLGLGWLLLFSDELAPLGKHVAGGAGFATNFVLWSEAGYFDTASETKPYLHLWSLAIEEQFYLVYPLLIFLLRGAPRRRPLVLSVLLLASLAASLYLSKSSPTQAFFLPHTRLWELLLGSLAAALPFASQKPAESSEPVSAAGPQEVAPRHPASLSRYLPLALSLAGLAAIAVSIFAFSATTPWPSGWALVPTLGALALLVAGERSAVSRLLLGNRVMVAIGLISYPLYLWHWLLLAFTRVLGANQPQPGFIVVAVVLSFALSAATYFFVEKPIRFGAKSRAKPIALAFALAVAGGLGLVMHLRDGFPERSINAMNRGAKGFHKMYHEMKENCVEVLGMTVKAGTCYANDPKPEIVFFGDSHAFAAFQPIFLGTIKARAAVIWSSGCLPFTGYTVRNKSGGDEKCEVFTETALKLFETTKSIQTVVVFKRPGRWMTAQMEGDIAVIPDGWSAQPKAAQSGDAAADPALDGEEPSITSYYFDGFDRLVTDLERLGKSQVFIIDNPDLTLKPEQCTERPLSLRKHKVLEPCRESRKELETHQASYLAIVERLRAAHPAMVVFDGRDPFCDKKYCYAKKGVNVLYRDSNHLNAVGAEMLVRPLMQALRRSPAAAGSAGQR